MANVTSGLPLSVGGLDSKTKRNAPPTYDDIDWTHVLTEVPLFSDLSRRHVRGIAKLAKIQRVQPYTDIVHEGGKAGSFFLILEGNAIVRPPGKRPKRLGPGDFFGELALLDNQPRSATVQTQEEVVVARIGRTDFMHMLNHEPKVAVILLQTLAERLRSSETSTTH